MNGRVIRVVLDTNIVISAVLARDGLESKILRRALDRELCLYTSLPILEEYRDVLERPKFRLGKVAVRQITQALRTVGIIVASTRSLAVSPDPGDNMFLECSEAAHANYLITGNLRHFPAVWKGTRIVSSRQFLASI